MPTRLRTHLMTLATVILALLVLLAAESWNRTRIAGDISPVAVAGVLDLRNWDPDKQGAVKLVGDWEFYWNALLSPLDLAAGLGSMSGYTEPGLWNGYIVDGQGLSGQGYATYTLTILMDPHGDLLAIRVPAQSTAFLLYVNGRQMASNGVVGTTAEDSVPQYMPLTVEMYNDYSEISLVMQVSNFDHRHGGMWDALTIGSEAALRAKNGRLILMDMFSVGSMFTMGSYHLVLYFMRKKNRSAAYFAGVCILYGIRAMTLGEFALTRIWPSFSWAALLGLGYLTSAGILPFGLLFLRELYPAETSKIAVTVSLVHYSVLAVIVALAPTTVSSEAVVYYQIGSAAMSVYILYVLVQASIRRLEGAIWLSVSILFFLMTLLNDMLYLNGVIHTATLSSLGLVVVCFAQAGVLAARFSGALTSVETLRDQLTLLNQQLTELNRGLEQRVSERTAALLESNKRLEQINAEIERMEQSRKHLLANIAHDLRTPVTLIQGYVEAMLDGVIEDPEQLNKYLKLIAGKASGLSHLIADLFELTQLESRRVTFDMRPILVTDLVDGLYMKYETDISHAGVTPVLIKPEWAEDATDTGPVAIADFERIDRVMSNLVYNAIKFTPRGGSITVSYRLAEPEGAKKPPAVVISVADSGTGIAAEDLPYVFDRFYKAPRARSQAPGSGLGLSIAREIVELHGGRIWAESAVGKGATFCFTLPLQT